MRRSVELGLVAYIAALLSLVTMSLAVDRVMFSTVFIDIRNFPGTEGYPPGPIGGRTTISSANHAHVILVNFPGFANQWLNDGLLVSSISNSAACGCYIHSSSYIVAMSFMP